MTYADRLLDRVSVRDWSDAQLSSIVGDVRSAGLTHATDSGLRAGAASGGSVTAVLVAALEAGTIDGALVLGSKVVDGHVRGEFRIVDDRAGLVAAQGSKYVAVNFVRDALPLIRATDGRLAVVALPCDVTTLRRRAEAEPEAIGAKVALTIGLFCSHNSRTDLVDMVTSRIEAQHGSSLEDFTFRTGHWRGQLSYRLADGTSGSASTSRLNDYRNLSLFSERKCLSCDDHFGYDADVSAGDVWLYTLRERPIKPTIVLVRTEAGQAAFDLARAVGAIEVEEVPARLALDGQARVAPHHHDVAARRKAGRLVGVNIRTGQRRRTRPFAFLDALITVAGTRLTESARGRRMVALLPHPVVRVLLVLRKGIALLAR